MQYLSWFSVGRQPAKAGVPNADNLWNYCDIKCLSFQKIVPDTDFYIVNFWTSRFTPQSAACYGKSKG